MQTKLHLEEQVTTLGSLKQDQTWNQTWKERHSEGQTSQQGST